MILKQNGEYLMTLVKITMNEIAFDTQKKTSFLPTLFSWNRNQCTVTLDMFIPFFLKRHWKKFPCKGWWTNSNTYQNFISKQKFWCSKKYLQLASWKIDCDLCVDAFARIVLQKLIKNADIDRKSSANMSPFL